MLLLDDSIAHLADVAYASCTYVLLHDGTIDQRVTVGTRTAG